MAKKRKGAVGGAFGNSAKVAKTGNEDDASKASSVDATKEAGADEKKSDNVEAERGTKKLGEVYCIKSSLGVPFLVISDKQLVSDVPAPTPDDWKELQSMCGAIAKQWDSSGAAVLADFEGEMMGFEGELVCAAFQRSFAIDPKSLRHLENSRGVCRDVGLLVDLRCAGGIALVKRIMESERVQKLVWGADGDVTALRYSPALRPLAIESSSVVDAQLAYSTEKKRLGMGKMLEQVPADCVAGLPAKDAIDFNTPHSRNRRALALPMARNFATYAVDDLHRLDAILRTKKPKTGSYVQALTYSTALIARMLANPGVVSADKLRQYESMLTKDPGPRKLALAVRIKRHLIAIRHHAPAAAAEFVPLEAIADEILKTEAVSIPQDLSFCS